MFIFVRHRAFVDLSSLISLEQLSRHATYIDYNYRDKICSGRNIDSRQVISPQECTYRNVAALQRYFVSCSVQTCNTRPTTKPTCADNHIDAVHTVDGDWSPNTPPPTSPPASTPDLPSTLAQPPPRALPRHIFQSPLEPPIVNSIIHLNAFEYL